jgi:hypothetical protein
MRQRLTNQKRRKAIKLRQREGAIVEILYRRDIARLARRWGLMRLRGALDDERT